jgi:hypothetical protein
LYNYLLDPATFWIAAGPGFHAVYGGRLQCVVGLIQRMGSASEVTGPPMRLQWYTWAVRISQLWPPRESDAWEALFVDLAEEQNRLAIACVSSSLLESVSRLPVADDLLKCVQAIASSDLSWCEDLPVLPSPGKPSQASEYLIGPEWLATTHERLDELADTYVGDDSAAASRLFAVQRLQKTVRLLQEGWPVARGEVAVVIGKLSEELRAWQHSTGRNSEHAPRIARFVEHLEEVVDRVADRGGPADADNKRPVERKTAEAEPCETTDASKIKRELERLESCTDSQLAREIGSRLGSLLELLSGDDGRASRSLYNRKLLSCLIFIDDTIAKPGRPTQWLIECRDELRMLLLKNAEYRILDSELLGRSIRSCMDLAEAVGFRAGTEMPSHCIVAVKQAGYAVQSEDGSAEVVRRAKVLLAQ